MIISDARVFGRACALPWGGGSWKALLVAVVVLILVLLLVLNIISIIISSVYRLQAAGHERYY